MSLFPSIYPDCRLRDGDTTTVEVTVEDEETGNEITYQVSLYVDSAPDYPSCWHWNGCVPEAPSPEVERRLLEEAAWKVDRERQRFMEDAMDYRSDP